MIKNSIQRFMQDAQSSSLRSMTTSWVSLLNTENLYDHLIVIKTRIERRREKNRIIKGLTVLRLYSRLDRDDMFIVLQEYQTRASMMSKITIQKVLVGMGLNAMSKDIEKSLFTIREALSRLDCNMTRTENEFIDLFTQ